MTDSPTADAARVEPLEVPGGGDGVRSSGEDGAPSAVATEALSGLLQLEPHPPRMKRTLTPSAFMHATTDTPPSTWAAHLTQEDTHRREAPPLDQPDCTYATAYRHNL
jgi:hypothetical protein